MLRLRVSRCRFRSGLALLLLAAILSGCAGATPTPSEPDPVTDSAQSALFAYKTKVRHPENPEIDSVRALFKRPDSPPIESLQKCDFDYRVETMLSRSIEELLTTLPEHVRSDPEKYHWCFYAKVIELEDALARMQADPPAARRKLILNRYRFFVYLARVFEVDLEDSRYLDFARFNYKRLMASNPE